MPVDAKLLEILCCPVSKSPLLRLGGDRLENLNRMIGAGEVLYVDGRTVTGLLQEGLITDDGKVVYAVQDGIPVLLAEEGIGTAQFENF
jgi:uncharacterized protein YbaR (Trm112 family)